MSEPRPIRLLILGLGNLLCGDDGLGVVAVQRLLRERLEPEGCRILDGGTLGLALLPYLEDAERVILVDAIHGDGPAGSLIRLEGEEVLPAVYGRLSVHQVGVADLLEAARWRGRLPVRCILVGLVPQRLELGLGLSPPVEAAMDRLLQSVVEEADALGYALARQSAAEVAARSAVVGRCGGSPG